MLSIHSGRSVLPAAEISLGPGTHGTSGRGPPAPQDMAALQTDPLYRFLCHKEASVLQRLGQTVKGLPVEALRPRHGGKEGPRLRTALPPGRLGPPGIGALKFLPLTLPRLPEHSRNPPASTYSTAALQRQDLPGTGGQETVKGPGMDLLLGGCSGKAPPYHLQTSLLGLKGGKGIAAVGLTLHKKGLHQMMPGLTVCPFYGNHSLF